MDAIILRRFDAALACALLRGMRTWILVSTLALALPLTACGDDTGGAGGSGGSGSGGGDASTTDAATTGAATTGSTTSTTSATSGGTTTSTTSGAGGDVEEVTCPGTADAELTNDGLTGFLPSAITIPVGGIVHFAPTGPHNVTLDDGSFATTTSVDTCVKFNVAGSFPFHCSVHVGMVGDVTVE